MTNMEDGERIVIVKANNEFDVYIEEDFPA